MIEVIAGVDDQGQITACDLGQTAREFGATDSTRQCDDRCFFLLAEQVNIPGPDQLFHATWPKRQGEPAYVDSGQTFASLTH
jgi:hypothetical protein